MKKLKFEEYVIVVSFLIEAAIRNVIIDSVRDKLITFARSLHEEWEYEKETRERMD